MQTTSALYKQIIADENHSFEVKLDIAGTEYGMDSIFSARGTAKTFETEPTIGGVYSATLDFSLLTDGASIPRMAKVIPYFRATDGAGTSKWIKKGEFYIDVRSVTSNGDGLNVFMAQCFDGMLKANAPYANSSLSWPATDTAVVAEICTALGFTQDARNAGIMTAGYSIPSAPVDLTYRDVLSYIAAMYGANWIMTDAGELRLLPLGEGTDTLTVGNNVQNLNVSPKRNGYTKVILETSEGVAIESGASDEVVITAFCPYATQAIADAVLTALASFEYQPFGAVGVWADPAVEIGDNMSAVTTTGTVFSREIEFGTGMVMNLSSPNDNYTDHEYSYESPTERRYKRSIGGLRSEIAIQEGKISLVVSETSGGDVVNAASIVTAINGSSSSVIISADKIDLEGYVTVTDLSTQGQTVINGANITTGIIQDSQNKNYWNMQTGELVIRNGRLNVYTAADTDDYIVLDGAKTTTSIGNYYIMVRNKSTASIPNARTVILGGAIYQDDQLQDDGSGGERRLYVGNDGSTHGALFSDASGIRRLRIGEYSSGVYGQNYYDANGDIAMGISETYLRFLNAGVETVRLENTGNLVLGDGTNTRWRISNGQLTGYNASGTQSVVIGNTGWSYFGTGGQGHKMHIRSNADGVDGVYLDGTAGEVTAQDGSSKVKGILSSSALRFYDANNNAVANFLKGLWVPWGYVTVETGIYAVIQAAGDSGDGMYQVAGSWTNHPNGYSGIVTCQSYSNGYSAQKIFFGIIAASDGATGGVWAFSFYNGASLDLYRLDT